MFRKYFVLISISIVAALCLSGCGGSSKTVGVAVTASASTVDATDAVTLTATVTNDKNAGGVTWSVSGGGTLSNTTTTSATYTAPAASSTALTVTVTATSVADATKTGTATIAVPAAPSITTSALLAGTVGTAYSATIAGSGGITPYTWTITSGTLPSGLSMNSAGVISGTPVAAGVGTTNLTFQIRDSGTATALTATKTLGLTINAAPAITFTGTVPATGMFNVAYTGSAAASGGGGALTYTVSAGSLPAGLSLNASSGAITGTPTAVGTSTFTIRAADAYGDSATQGYSIVVSYPALTVTTAATLPVGYVGGTYSKTLTATGGSGAGYQWSVTAGSVLPGGLSLSAGGVLSGQPTTQAISTFSVTVTDSASNVGSATLSLTVNAGVSITTPATLPVAYAGSNYSQTLAATGGTGSGYTWAVTSGSSLPAGLSLSTSGILSGRPTTTGTPTFSITATDTAANTASVVFSLTINPGISITSSATLPKGYQGGVYPGATLTATGGSNSNFSWTWAAASGSSLPAGLSLSTGGVVSGTPTASGTFSIVVTVTDSASNTATQTVSLTVEATLAISTASPLHGGSINIAYTQTMAATGGSGSYPTWTVTQGGASLTALNLSLSTGGVLSGTPTSTGGASFTVQVTDSESHTATANFTLTIYAALTITTTSLPAGFTGTAYSQTLAAAGGTGTNYSWTAASSNLSTYGLSLSSAGVVTGTPSQTGTVSFTAQVTDSGSNTASQPLSFTVYNPMSLPTPSSTVPGPATVGSPYNGTISLSGGSGNFNWTVTGLPADSLSAALSGATQHITGTPATAQTVSFSISVTDTTTSQSIGPISYSILVSNPPPLTLPTPNPSSLPAAIVGQAYTGAINATGGVAPYVWTVNSTPVPTNGSAVSLTNGLSVTNTGGNTLAVGGTPSSSGSVTIAASIKDNLNTVAGPNTYSVTVNPSGYQVTGNIFPSNFCGGSSNMPSFTLAINTSPVQTVTSDSNGYFAFSNIPNGTYTITPSIVGPSAMFYPATLTGVVVNGATVTGANLSASLGYTITGNVSYGGTATGRTYVTLTGGCSGLIGTSIAAPGAFTIHGVPPGTYTVKAWMDTVGYGFIDQADPLGKSTNVTVSGSSLSGKNVTMTDPATYSLTSGPTIKAISPTDQGVVLNFTPIIGKLSDGTQVEVATSYTVQWSTSSSFTGTPSSYTFSAGAPIGAGVLFLNNSTTGISGTFTNGTQYYFRARGMAASGAGPWTTYGSPTAITIGAPSAANTISGAVTFTGTATGPMYVGFYDTSNGLFYGTRIASPVSPQAYSTQVPNGTSYYFVGIVDNNNDALIDRGDFSNTSGNMATTSITGSASGQNLTLPSGNAIVRVTTSHGRQQGVTGSDNYNLNFDVRQGIKMPVAAQMTSGPNVINPVDLGKCIDCGNNQLEYWANTSTVSPTVGDTYAINVTYSDGTSETLNGSVSAVLNAFASNLAPYTGSSISVTPTFTWTYPSNASSYLYEFWISDNNGNNLWQIPGNNSNSNGFSNSVSSIVWGTDPTGNTGNTPSVTTLTLGTSYMWNIQTMDNNGNDAVESVSYVP